MHTATELLLGQPGVVFAHLARHAGHYAKLTQLEAEVAAAQWLRRGVAGLLALLAAMVALVLAGVAVMLAASPQAGLQAGWPLAYWAVPALPALLALAACAVAMRRPAPAFELLRQQLQLDLQLLAPGPAAAADPDPAAAENAARTAEVH